MVMVGMSWLWTWLCLDVKKPLQPKSQGSQWLSPQAPTRGRALVSKWRLERDYQRIEANQTRQLNNRVGRID